MRNAELAMEYHAKGCNCAQSVALSFLQETKLSEEELFKATEAFGLGMGSEKGTCGAISGALVILGFLSSSGTYTNVSKKETYQKAAKLCDRFESIVGNTICGKIKQSESSCSFCIQTACTLLEDIANVID